MANTSNCRRMVLMDPRSNGRRMVLMDPRSNGRRIVLMDPRRNCRRIELMDPRRNCRRVVLMEPRGWTSSFFPSERGMDPTASDLDTEAFLDELTADVMHLQHAKLREILELQVEVEYLQRHGLNGRTDVESFRKCVPVVSYGDLETDILRLVNGETNAPVFTVDPITEFHVSSGTTGGKSKYFPGTDRAFGEEFRFFYTFLDASFRKAFPGLKRGTNRLKY